MATAIPQACLASSAIRCRDVETGPNLGVLAVFPSNGATCRCPLPSTGSRRLNSPASVVLCDTPTPGRPSPRASWCFRHQLLLPRPYLVLTKPLRLDIQCRRGASVKIGWKYLDD